MRRVECFGIFHVVETTTILELEGKEAKALDGS